MYYTSGWDYNLNFSLKYIIISKENIIYKLFETYYSVHIRKPIKLVKVFVSGLVTFK